MYKMYESNKKMYKKLHSKLSLLHHGGHDKYNESFWANITGDLFYHPAHGILYKVKSL